jgi:hypothetical protein
MSKATFVKNILSRETEERDFQWHPGGGIVNIELREIYGVAYAPPITLTLKGRYESWGDLKEILNCASNAKGIIRLNFENFSFEVTWLLEEVHYKAGVIDHRKDAIQFIDEFVDLLRKKQNLHVFIESLKPINQYDGERNGPWALR